MVDVYKSRITSLSSLIRNFTVVRDLIIGFEVNREPLQFLFNYVNLCDKLDVNAVQKTIPNFIESSQFYSVSKIA